METNTAHPLDLIESFLRKYIYFPCDNDFVALTLWIAHTWVYKHFYTTPRLVLSSPERSCGKTRVYEVAELLCPGSRILISITPASLFRLMNKGNTTLLIDEVDNLWGAKGTDSSDMVAMINGGYRRGAKVCRTEKVGDTLEPVDYDVFGPVAMAGIGDKTPGTILSRSIIINMVRRDSSVKLEDFDEEFTRKEGDGIADSIHDWVTERWTDFSAERPEIPEGVRDRQKDAWIPLLRIADLAGGLWPDRARKAAVYFAEISQDAKRDASTELLSDIRDIFNDHPNRDFIPTNDLRFELHQMDDRPWGEWNHGKAMSARGLGRQLANYHISSCKDLRQGNQPRGYFRKDFEDAWKRYLPEIEAPKPKPKQKPLPENPWSEAK